MTGEICLAVGRLSRSQVSTEQFRTYANEENQRRRNVLQKYIRLCTESKVCFLFFFFLLKILRYVTNNIHSNYCPFDHGVAPQAQWSYIQLSTIVWVTSAYVTYADGFILCGSFFPCLIIIIIVINLIS